MLFGAIVCAFLATACSTFEDVALLQTGHEPDAPALVQLINHAPRSTATSLLEPVKDMVLVEIHGGKRSNDTILLKVTEMMEDDVIDGILNDHAAEQTIIETEHAAILTCTSDMQAEQDGINGMVYAATNANSTHLACRESQSSVQTTSTTECNAFSDFRSTLAPGDCAPFPSTSSDKDEQERCLKWWSEWSTANLETFGEKKTNCETAETATDEQTQLCSVEQTAFEKAFCDYAVEVTSVCNVYTACLSSTESLYATTTATVKAAEEKRKAEYSAAKKIICFLKVLEAEDAEGEFAACENTSVDTSLLNTDYPAVPNASTCDKTYADANDCSTHYVGWPENAPVDSCTECSLPASSSTTAPTSAAFWTLYGSGKRCSNHMTLSSTVSGMTSEEEAVKNCGEMVSQNSNCSADWVGVSVHDNYKWCDCSRDSCDGTMDNTNFKLYKASSSTTSTTTAPEVDGYYFSHIGCPRVSDGTPDGWPSSLTNRGDGFTYEQCADYCTQMSGCTGFEANGCTADRECGPIPSVSQAACWTFEEPPDTIINGNCPNGANAYARTYKIQIG